MVVTVSMVIRVIMVIMVIMVIRVIMVIMVIKVIRNILVIRPIIRCMVRSVADITQHAGIGLKIWCDVRNICLHRKGFAERFNCIVPEMTREIWDCLNQAGPLLFTTIVCIQQIAILVGLGW
ncbi:hypothetical protein CAPTEDRAFT_188811 [Capitella teleta]|uniref:Uncharacterized protein n=1 Tax=Capitella teleta TaxID=283909 RepID=R7V9I2_CAPTE|nr:hypothetical protein CAPTEDRAFT_188811 [Capitella teleta]|eukprot:ELU15157.1 hypothetical protein CAPTEDRAFT_188811 [Capitella teleta]